MRLPENIKQAYGIFFGDDQAQRIKTLVLNVRSEPFDDGLNMPNYTQTQAT